MSRTTTRGILALSFALMAVGFLLPLWPLTLFGIALVALSGQWIVAVLLGILLDIVYGAPIGHWHFLYFPFTIFALVVALVHQVGVAYMRGNSRNTLY